MATVSIFGLKSILNRLNSICMLNAFISTPKKTFPTSKGWHFIRDFPLKVRSLFTCQPFSTFLLGGWMEGWGMLEQRVLLFTRLSTFSATVGGVKERPHGCRLLDNQRGEVWGHRLLCPLHWDGHQRYGLEEQWHRLAVGLLRLEAQWHAVGGRKTQWCNHRAKTLKPYLCSVLWDSCESKLRWTQNTGVLIICINIVTIIPSAKEAMFSLLVVGRSVI